MRSKILPSAYCVTQLFSEKRNVVLNLGTAAIVNIVVDGYKS